MCNYPLHTHDIHKGSAVYVFSGFPLAASLCLASAYILLSTLGGNVGSGNVLLITSKKDSTLLGSGGYGGGDDSSDSAKASTARLYILSLMV